jgi:ATP-binding cassette, subfamily F, member 3
MITLKNIELRRGNKVLLQQASIAINPGEKIGLVGRNGAGKSSLFALLNGQLHEDSGEFFMPTNWRMAQVAQHMPETAQSAAHFVLEGDTRLAELNEQLAQAEALGDGMHMAQLHADLHDAGQHDALARAESLILGLGFAADQLDRPVNSFSGGWRMRLQLARALMCPSDLLLLDEPTNHLDLDALVWLEDWLQRYEGTMLVISHDREFLDAVTRVTLHIEQGRLTRYGGNYSAFELLRAQQLSLQQAALSKQQDKMAHLQKFIDRFKAKASKAKQAQSRVKALERMEKIAPILAEADFSFEFKEPDSLPNPMLSLRDARFGYRSETGDATVILQDVSRTVLAGQRIGILGANGQGKSTLIKTIARTLGVLGGEVTEGKGLRIGYFAQQELDVLRTDEDPLAHMVRLARELGLQGSPGSREQDLRGFLGGFNFSGDMVKQAVGTMSGGEKARLVLAMLVWQRPNLLLLDEPTNHLDLATREALAMALNSFEGTLMLVSHDRALLRAVCDDFWLVGRGAVKDFDGDLEDYQRYLLDEAKRQRDALRDKNKVQKPAAAPRASGAEQRKRQAQERQAQLARLRPVRKALEETEQGMAQLAQAKAALEQRLAAPASPADMADVGKQLKTTTDALAQAEERWLELSEQLQAMEASEAV